MGPDGRWLAADDALRRRDEAHAARLSVLGVLSASIAHEISQRLGAILANVDAAQLILDQQHPDLDQLLRIVRDIRADDLGARDVIARMRALVRREPPALASLRFNDPVDDALRLVACEARRRGVAIVAHLGTDLPCIEADRVQLQQVVINLVVNAMDAVSGGVHAEVRIQTRRCAEGVELRVEDNGPGIPASSAGQLFAPFFSTKATGTGLGLAIVRGIVEAHRGRVWAEQGMASGAVFRAWLPALSPA
jgi:C4-dicarboxylate-specific signal transduction histidine kinase